MIYLRAIETKFDGNVDQVTLQTLAGVFTIKELRRNSQPGQLVVTADAEIEVIKDGQSIIIGTRRAGDESV